MRSFVYEGGGDGLFFSQAGFNQDLGSWGCSLRDLGRLFVGILVAACFWGSPFCMCFFSPAGCLLPFFFGGGVLFPE